MKTLFLFLFICISTSASARPEFVAYESLSPDAQRTWGYAVQRSNHGIHVVVPPAAAKVCEGARIIIRDKQQRILAQFDGGLKCAADGSVSVSFDLIQGIDGQAELLIASRVLSGAVAVPDFAGFKFVVRSSP